jgi:hypothetical protein
VAPTAARAEAPTFAGEGDQPIQAAARAPESGETAGQPPAAEEVVKLLFDESWQPFAVAQGEAACARKVA